MRLMHAAGTLALAALLVLGVSCVRSRDTGPLEEPAPRPQETMAFLALDCGADSATLILGDGTNTIEVERGNQPVRVPPGSYVPILCVLESEDADGVKWRVASSVGRAGAPVVAERGATAQVACGAPFTARLTHVRAGSAIVFHIEMTGQAGLMYSPTSISQGGIATPAPGVVIRNADGEEIARGAFKYG